MKNLFFLFYLTALLFTTTGLTAQVDYIDERTLPELSQMMRDYKHALAPIGLSMAELDSFNMGYCGTFFTIAYVHEENKLVEKLMCRIDFYPEKVKPWFLFLVEKFIVVLDEEAKDYPVVRLIGQGKDPSLATDKVLVRISKSLFEKAPCLPDPSPADEWKGK